MPNEEQTEEVVLLEENNEEVTDTVEAEGSEDTGVVAVDYRGKLNAQNHFLKKEGYTFEGGRWNKPKPVVKESSPTVTENLSTKDVLYLAKADIHAEDVDDILVYAFKMGVDVSAAHSHYKPILAERAEERKTASATQTKGSPRGTSKVSGENILAKAERTGEIPQSDEDLEALFAARQARRTRRKN